MEYELKVLEHIITVVLNPSRITRDTLNDEFLSECKLLIETERERIRNQFRVMVFSDRQQSDLESYYRKHQAILVQLVDIVFNYLQPGGPESIYRLTSDISISNFYKEIAQIPGDLLDFIEKSFPEYFDHGIKVPEAKRWLMAPEMKRSLKGIQKEVEKLEVDDELIKIACKPLEDYLLPGEVISYHELSYLQELQRELISFIKKKDKANLNEELCRLLLHLNFNSISFFSYYILQLQEKSNGCNTLPDLIEYHSLKLKIINQLPVKAGLVYKTGLPAIREQVGSWICEELYYLEKQERFLYLDPRPKNELQQTEMKVHTSLSVSHLAMAVKLLVEAKLITNTNSSDLIRMVARNFRTDRQEVISEESLRNKLYSFETATVTRLKDEIVGLMNLVRKY